MRERNHSSAAVLSGISGMGIAEGINPVRSLIISVAMAALTFIMAFSALRNIIKARRSHDAYQIILRNISQRSGEEARHFSDREESPS